MNKRKCLLSAAILLSFVAIASADQSMTAWEWFVDATPPAGSPRLCSVTLSAQVLEQAHDDLADLRLMDANGHEIPFAARVRREVDEVRRFQTREFNRAEAAGGIGELTVDLGESAGGHNEIEVDTEGQNFRRQVGVDGSDDGTTWRVLKPDGIVFRFEANNRGAESNRIGYPVSRYRYLRARVSRDLLVDKETPGIKSIAVMMTVLDKGESVSWHVGVPQMQPVRAERSPASAWLIDLRNRVPCNRLLFDVTDQSFSRSFTIEKVDDPQNVTLVASGEIKRRGGEERKPIVIGFDEVHARRLRLTVTDFANPAISIASIQASAPARQLLFEMKSSFNPPLRLYAGNPRAESPRYDFENELPSKLGPELVKYETGSIQPNPSFQPDPKALTERVPWLIYAVLAISSIALALILVSLVRSVQRGEAAEPDKAEAL